MKKIMSSMVVLMAALVAVTLGSVAYFSDVEISENNRFIAGEIDLEVGFDSTYNGDPDKLWGLKDLGATEIFFDFIDVKPGDLGEGLISLEVNSNESWLCSNITLTGADDNGRNEPEIEDGDPDDGAWAGELDDNIQFFFWADDGDGLYEAGESVILSSTPASGLDQGPGNDGDTFDLVDATTDVINGVPGTPLAPATTEYIGQAWCFGDLGVTPDSPFTCDGSLVDNQPQSDDLEGTITFYAVQSRNNTSFECSSWNPNVVL